MELVENYFSQKSVIARGRSVTPFFWAKRPLSPPPKKNCLSSEANIGLFLQNFNNGSTSQLRSIARKRSVTPFFWAKCPLSPPLKKNCLSSEANIGLFVQNFNNGSTSQLRSISLS